ncbi:MAG: hypothetical protein JSV09_06300 [Thermoplasmata archaeon]|nr:MAG: hypothetical protein JSV09_06300 [Thermoplasmata archaeon]
MTRPIIDDRPRANKKGLSRKKPAEKNINVIIKPMTKAIPNNHSPQFMYFKPFSVLVSK